MDHINDPHGQLTDFMMDLFVRRTTGGFRSDGARHLERIRPGGVIHSFSDVGGALAAEVAGVAHVMHLAGWTTGRTGSNR